MTWRRIQKSWTACYGNIYKVSKAVMVSSREGTRNAQIGMDYLDLRGEVAEEKIDISARQVRRRQWSRNHTPSSNIIQEKVTLPPPWIARQTLFCLLLLLMSRHGQMHQTLELCCALNHTHSPIHMYHTELPKSSTRLEGVSVLIFIAIILAGQVHSF